MRGVGPDTLVSHKFVLTEKRGLSTLIMQRALLIHYHDVRVGHRSYPLTLSAYLQESDEHTRMRFDALYTRAESHLADEMFESHGIFFKTRTLAEKVVHEALGASGIPSINKVSKSTFGDGDDDMVYVPSRHASIVVALKERNAAKSAPATAAERRALRSQRIVAARIIEDL